MDQEPITIIMTVIPIVGRGIYLLAKKINSIVQNMSSNKKDWQELNGHIQEVMRCLKYIDSNVKIHREVQSSIHNLAMCIEECWKFLQDYIHASALQQLIFHHHFRRKFEELNERLVAWKDRFLFVVSAYQLAKSSQTRNTVPIIQKPSVQPHHLAFLSPNIHAMRRLPGHNSSPQGYAYHRNIGVNSLPNPIFYSPAANRKYHY